MAQWNAFAQIHLGWALSQRGIVSGFDQIEAGLRAADRIGVGRFRPFHLDLAADAYARAGRYDEAQLRIATAFATPSHGNGRVFAAQLHRVRASLMLNTGDRDAAEADLRRALEIARGQEARSLELRAARDQPHRRVGECFAHPAEASTKGLV